MKRVIVSRHPAAVEFIRRSLGAVEWDEAPVLASATAEDVDGAIVAGNLPLHLAALAAEVIAVEFDSGSAPRGTEYTLEDMEASGARLVRYRVVALGAIGHYAAPAPKSRHNPYGSAHEHDRTVAESTRRRIERD